MLRLKRFFPLFLALGLVGIVLSGAICLCSSPRQPPPVTVTPSPVVTPLQAPTSAATAATPEKTATPAPSPTAAKPEATAAPVATATPSLPPGARQVTLTDEEVTPLLPIRSAWAHFLPNNEVRVGYRGLGFRLKLGIADGRLYADGVPPWLDITVIDKNAARYSTRDGARVVITDFPAWFDLSRYDKELTAMPELVALETRDGAATVWYLPLP